MKFKVTLKPKGAVATTLDTDYVRIMGDILIIFQPGFGEMEYSMADYELVVIN